MELNNLSPELLEDLASLINESKYYLDDRGSKLEKIEEAELSLYEFHKQAWEILEPDPFIEGWYLEVLCEHLEALFKREIKNLIVNLPPRMGKSTLISVTAPAWRFIQNPEERFVYASHSQTLAHDLSIKCRRLILSEWYQLRWGHLFNLVGDQNTKGRFDNDKTGYRIATTVGSLFTGGGGSALFCLPYDIEITTDDGNIMIGELYFHSLYRKDEPNNPYFNKIYKVLSYNHEQEQGEYKEIEKYEYNGEKEILEIELDDRTLQCSEDHPIYVKGYGYIPAKYLQIGHILVCI